MEALVEFAVQCGENVAMKIDRLIQLEKKADKGFAPGKRKEMADGSTIFQFQFNIEEEDLYKDDCFEDKLLDFLGDFDDLDGFENAWKFIGHYGIADKFVGSHNGDLQGS